MQILHKKLDFFENRVMPTETWERNVRPPLLSFDNGGLPFYKNRHVPKNATPAAGEAVGYTDNSHFIKRFGEYCGLTPLQYKKAYGDKK